MQKLFSKFLDSHLIQYAQPVVDAKNYKVLFFEVLSRATLDNNIYEPRHFMDNISDEEKFEMAHKIIEKIVVFQKKLPTQSFSINVSHYDLNHGLIDILDGMAREKLIDPKRLIIEMVETSILDDYIRNKMKLLKTSHGYRFALDDFGAKYSNMQQIYTSNGLFEIIKIDGSLISNIEHDLKIQQSLKKLIEIIHIFNKKAVVEYVSSCTILKIAQEMGADYVQGYVFGMPSPMEYYEQKLCQDSVLPCQIDLSSSLACSMGDTQKNCRLKDYHLGEKIKKAAEQGQTIQNYCERHTSVIEQNLDLCIGK